MAQKIRYKNGKKMARMYVRVPHYVAAYYRNRNERKPVAVGGSVSLENEPQLYDMLLYGLVRNPREEIVKEGCFCDRMWRKMMRGQSLVSNNKGKRTSIKRNPKEMLTDAEIRELCQLPAAHNEEADEYLCIELPPYIYRNGMQIAIDGQWQLRSRTLQTFCGAMRKSFWNTCMTYIEEFLSAGKKQGYKHSVMEGIERFMMRYDIRSNESNKEKMTLKRNYYRQLRYRQQHRFDYTEFGE